MKVFAISIVVLASLLVLSNAYASPYKWNTSSINATWTVVPINNGITIGDSNNDGVADYVYTLSGNTKLTKQFGTGVSSFDISLGNNRGLLYAHSNRILAWYEGGSSCYTSYAVQWNALTGLNITSTLLSSTPAGGTSVTSFGGIINLHNQTATMCSEVAGGLLRAIESIHDTPNKNQTFTSGSPTTSSNEIMGMTANAPSQIIVYLFTNTQYTNQNSTSSTCGTSYPFIDSKGFCATTSIFGNYGPAQSKILDPQIIKYYNGLLVPTVTVPTAFSIQSYLASPVAHSMSLLANIPPDLLNNAFAGSVPVYFQMNDGTNTYLAALVGTNLYYTNYNILLNQVQNNRSFANYIVDPASLFVTKNINDTLSTKAISIFKPDSTQITYNAPEQTVLPTGYYWQVPGETRFYYPDFTNSTIQMPTDTFDSTTSLWTTIISNGPTDGAIMFTNSTNYGSTGLAFVNSVNSLQADHSTTTSLVNNRCYNVYVSNTNIATPIWLYQGQICASGLNPKNLAYTNTLPMTFFTLTYGATDSYNPSNNGLSTTVRSATAPFSYNILVKNSTGTVAINQTFTTNSTIDTRNFNVSSVTKPASLYITISGVGQIYSAYLGSSISLASTASFFHQYFNYQGFDFLSFIPIVFASAFTRNTVGIGAALTVILIATLSWLSVVVVSDTIIFLMMFIAIISMIGYRGLYG